MAELSHVDGKGEARMVDVSAKPVQRRVARASGSIRMATETLSRIRENRIAKGDVLSVARIAGIQAAKKTSSLIPLCHPLLLDHVEVLAEEEEDGVRVTSSVTCTGRTGAEMEALSAVSVALLTLYDMCKAVDKAMCMGEIRLLEKRKQDVTDL